MSPETYEIFDRINVKTGLKEKYRAEAEAKAEAAEAKAEEAKAKAEAAEAKAEAAEAKAKAEAALKMLQKGYQAQEIADIFEMPVPWVESLTS